MDAMIVRAYHANYLDATHLSNGPDRVKRERFRRPIRLPHETWDKVQLMKDKLSKLFPDRYITLNSTLEFIINEGLEKLPE